MRKGFKKAKGVPAFWEEVKKRCNLALTPTAIAGLDELAKERDLSRSELVEHIGRRLIELSEPEAEAETL